MDETAVMSYKEQLEVWKEKEEERQHLFTITDDLKKYQVMGRGVQHDILVVSWMLFLLLLYRY